MVVEYFEAATANGDSGFSAKNLSEKTMQPPSSMRWRRFGSVTVPWEDEVEQEPRVPREGSSGFAVSPRLMRRPEASGDAELPAAPNGISNHCGRSCVTGTRGDSRLDNGDDPSGLLSLLKAAVKLSFTCASNSGGSCGGTISSSSCPAIKLSLSLSMTAVPSTGPSNFSRSVEGRAGG